MKKIVKICLISFLLVGVFAVALLGSFVAVSFVKFQSIPLEAEALTSSTLSIEVYTSENKPMKEENQFSRCKLEELPAYTKNAFISIEDKEFYKHHGLNKKRMVGAMVNNIKSGRLKEGASTISQQLIKNTHLTNEKTFERKLKEIALTKKLEKAFSKDEILESYLNVIFFGNNCYGLEEASQYYFNKEAKNLNLQESCTLAGLIKSPSRYSPIHHPKTCKTRRNLVLSEMEKDGFISVDEKITAQNSEIKLDIQPRSNSLNTYSQSAIDEASKILNLPAKQLAVGNYKIHTYCNEEKQAELQKALENVQVENCDSAAIAIDSKKFAVSAYVGNSNFKVLDCRRQPASCLKPILVYAPALNEEVISPSTQILDEKITIGGYSPSNVNKKYAGWMSVTDAVKNSVNIPAIKVLSYIGIDTGKAYAQKLGIEFDELDDSYALALGGMTYGVNLKELASAYTVFPNSGQWEDCTFVEYITDSNNKLVYAHKPNPKMVLREDSAYLMTNILQETAKTGTARKLSMVENTEVAAKTGTVGKKNASGNTDAYCLSYTPEEVVGVWFGNLNNTPLKVAGGNQPTEVARTYIQSQTYENITFQVPSSVSVAQLDTLELEENHRLVLASPYAPDRYKTTALFSRFNLPEEVSQNFTEKPTITADAQVENNQIVLSLTPQKHIKYEIFKGNTLCQTITEKDEPLTLRYNFPEPECTLTVTATYSYNSEQNNSSCHPDRSEAKWKDLQTTYPLTSTKTFNLKHQNPRSNTKWYI